MSAIKRKLEEKYEEECQDELNSPELLSFECPICGNKLREIEYIENEMSEAQYQEYLAGYSRELECPYCGYSGFHNISEYIQNISVPDEFIKKIDIYKLSPEDFQIEEIPEYFIEYAKRANEKECYIEAISLTHNLLENFIKKQFQNKFGKFKTNKDIFFKKIDDFKEEKFKEIVNDKTKEEFKETFSNQLYLSHWNCICFIFNLYNIETFKKIKKVNKERNNTIHNLLNLKESENIITKYDNLKSISNDLISLYDEIRKDIRINIHNIF